ncbi:MAG: hypothetical protein ACLQFR_30735 [Streptosporangiaceae bacterium]
MAAAGAAAMVLVVGCSSSAPPARGQAALITVPAASLDTSLATPAGSWAAVVMGGPAAQHNNFWQLFTRPSGATRWRLVTPPGTADNGGLVLAADAGQPVITAIRPSQYLTYTPLTQTRDGGQAWSAVSPLDAQLASTPDALARQPTGGGLLALLANGTVETEAAGSTRWKTLATEQNLASTSAGRSCGPRALTAVAYSPSGVPLLAGACSRPGTAGIFAGIGRTWQPVGPAMPAALAGLRVSVLRLAASASQVVALLAVGSGHAASLLAAWSSDNGRHWALSPPLPSGDTAVSSASFGPAGTAAVITAAGRAEVITTAAGRWIALPSLPAGTATLSPGSGGQIDALAVRRAMLTVWQLPTGGKTWTRTQLIRVPIQYGSSG